MTRKQDAQDRRGHSHKKNNAQESAKKMMNVMCKKKTMTAATAKWEDDGRCNEPNEGNTNAKNLMMQRQQNDGQKPSNKTTQTSNFIVAESQQRRVQRTTAKSCTEEQRDVQDSANEKKQRVIDPREGRQLQRAEKDTTVPFKEWRLRRDQYDSPIQGVETEKKDRVTRRVENSTANNRIGAR